ncbi:MAG: hypothetical protein ACOC0P_06670 [Planctomycetota bacterium]
MSLVSSNNSSTSGDSVDNVGAPMSLSTQPLLQLDFWHPDTADLVVAELCCPTNGGFGARESHYDD